jgi:HK97 family phage major capsid protein
VYDSRLAYQGRVSAPGAYAADPRVVGLALAILIGAVLVAGVAVGAIDLSHIHVAAPFLAPFMAGPITDFAPSSSTRQKGEALAATRKKIADIFAAGKKEDGYDLSAEKLAELNGYNEEATKQAEAYEAAVTLEKQAFDNDLALKGLTNLRPVMPPDGSGGTSDGPIKARSVMDHLKEKSGELKALANGGPGTVSFDLSGADYAKMRARAGLKTLMTSSDIAPQADRQQAVPSAQFLADVTDLFVPGNTDRDTIEFYLESTFTNAAAETAEGSAAPESALSFTLTSYPVREISTFVPITRRALEDNSGLQSYIEGRLGHMIDLRRSGQLMAGNGTTPNLRGVLNVSGIQTQAKGSDPTPDAVYKAMVLGRTTGDAEPTAAVFHAQDWQNVKLLRTIDGLYIWGNPSDASPDRIWGLDVRVSNSITQHTAVVGAFRPYAQLFMREGATIEISTEHSTFFTERKAAILIYERLAVAWYRPSAFVTVTGL